MLILMIMIIIVHLPRGCRRHAWICATLRKKETLPYDQTKNTTWSIRWAINAVVVVGRLGAILGRLGAVLGTPWAILTTVQWWRCRWWGWRCWCRDVMATMVMQRCSENVPRILSVNFRRGFWVEFCVEIWVEFCVGFCAEFWLNFVLNFGFCNVRISTWILLWKIERLQTEQPYGRFLHPRNPCENPQQNPQQNPTTISCLCIPYCHAFW